MEKLDNKKEPEERQITSSSETQPEIIITNKLLEFQKRVSAISKDSMNPFFKSKYFDVNTVIDTIKPILNEVGLVVTQPLGFAGERNLLHTQVLDEEKVVASSSVLVPEIADIQKFGAALTYLRRYALVSLLLLQGEEDDDGNTASKSNPAPSASTGPSAGRTTSNGIPMTEKQNKMIHALMKEKGVMHLSEIGIEKIEKPTTSDGSMIIDKLMKYQIGEKIIQLEGEDNERDYPL